MPDRDTTSDSNALILAGAVARGAFEAGVLSVLAEAAVPVSRLVGTSAGALNAAVFGAGLATGRVVQAAEVLEDLWLGQGAWQDFAHISIDAWWHWQGALDTSRVEELVRQGIERVVAPKDTAAQARGGPPAEPDLKVTLITTDLVGRLASAPDGSTRTFYERPEHFVASDFLDPAMWPRIAKIAAASAAFPGLFAPPMVDGTPRVDGGAVNNAAISYAIEDGLVGAIYVVSTQPQRPPPPPDSLGGVALVGHLADILINERLSRDLLTARRKNARLARVTAALTGLPPDRQQEILAALGWRHIELVEISPAPPLEGSAFSGFFDPELRATYVAAGKVAAKQVLAARVPPRGPTVSAGSAS